MTGPSILIVDDAPDNLKVARIALESEGYDVWVAADGEEALQILEHFVPRLILMDLQMPGIDGFELTRRIKADPRQHQTQIGAVTAYAMKGDRERAFAAGCDGYIAKPIDPILLPDQIAAYLTESAPCQRTDREVVAPSILVIEDNPTTRKMIRVALETEAYAVLEAGSANEALAVLTRRSPSLILQDLILPDMDGLELVQRLRVLLGGVDVPILCLSGFLSGMDDARALKNGFNALLVKPLDPMLLLDVVRRHLAMPPTAAGPVGLGANALVTRSDDWSSAIGVLRDALGATVPAHTPADPDVIREAVLRRALAQLDRQREENARLSQQGILRGAQLSVLASVADALAHKGNLQGVMSELLSVCLDLAGISKGALYLLDGGALKPAHLLGFSASELPKVADFFGAPELLQRIAEQGVVTAIPSSLVEPDHAQRLLTGAGVSAALVVPVTWGECSYGALLLGANVANMDGQDALAFARILGSQFGQAIGLGRAFEQLHVSEERFRALVDSMEDVVVLDEQQRISGTYGRAARERPRAAEAMGQRFTELLGRDDEALHAHVHARVLAGASVVSEWSQSVAGELRHFEAAVSPLHDPDGRVHAIVRVHRDVTERKRLQTQVMVSDRMASVGMLAAGIAHEINNPLMAVLGNLELARGELAARTPPGVDVDLLQSLHDAFDAAERVRATVRDVRLFSRAEEERSCSVDVHAVLDSSLRIAGNEIRHRARLSKDYQLVPYVRGNESRLGQVFLNLIMNAAHAIAEGHTNENEIRVGTRVDALGKVVIEIGDTGSGMTPDIGKRVFTPFFTTKPAGMGTGLGLVICQRIISTLGGEISFESQPGQGTVFRVMLPPDPSLSQPSAPPLEARPASRRGSVLLIDDDIAIGALLTRALRGEHDVLVLTDAGAALARLSAGERYDVILCDLMMPAMSGAEFFEHVERDHADVASSVIFVTGGALTPAARALLARVPNVLLEKPFNTLSLRSTVNARIQPRNP
jgi:PAS domain S-box-containing protein